MKTVVSEIESWKRKVEVEVSPEEVHPHMEKAFQSYQKKMRIDGFRKGKIPLSIIRKRFGQMIRAEVSEKLIETFYRKAIEQEGLKVVAPGQIREISFEENQPFRFAAEVEVEPGIEVTDYKGIKVEKEILKVTEEDVDQTIEILRNEKAKMRPVAEGAKEGHIIEGDIQALDATGVPIIGNKWENRILEMATPQVDPVIQEQLMGVVEGEERRFKVPQTERGPNGQIQNREEHYSVKVKSVKEKILPELGDGFAQEMGDFQTFEEMKGAIHKRIEMQREYDAEQLLRNRLADHIIRRNHFDIPPSMIENGLNSLLENYREQSEEKIDESAFREEHKAKVEWNIKWRLIWHKIAEIENIFVSEDDVKAEIENIVASSDQNNKKMRAWFKDSKRRDNLKERLLEGKVVDFLKENAKVKEVVIKKSKKHQSSIITA
ncbi:trigger factor [bacterium]|nr:trigger factor [bacterium]